MTTSSMSVPEAAALAPTSTVGVPTFGRSVQVSVDGLPYAPQRQIVRE